MAGRVVAVAPHPFPKSTFFSPTTITKYFPLSLHWLSSVTSVCSPPMSPPGSEGPNVCRACRRMRWYPIRSLRAGGTGRIKEGDTRRRKNNKQKKSEFYQEVDESYNVAGSFDDHLSMQLEAPKSSHRK